MANRFVYKASETAPFYKAVDTEFEWFGGFAPIQKQRCIESLHNAFYKKHAELTVLEVSSKGKEELGNKLSAFNLLLKDENEAKTVEALFQGSKVFRSVQDNTLHQCSEAYSMTPRDAKHYVRSFMENEGRSFSFHGFCFRGTDFSREPKDYFYNWLYISALKSNPELGEALIKYDAFTDIEFNPGKQYNCQAIACAIFVGLTRAGILDEALKSPKDFLKIVYGKTLSF